MHDDVTASLTGVGDYALFFRAASASDPGAPGFNPALALGARIGGAGSRTTIKITMGMDILRGKTPAMVCKEMWTCLVA